MWSAWLLLLLSLQGARAAPALHREKKDVPEDFVAPLEQEETHFGLVDDYGLAPRFPRMRNRTTRKAAAGLAQVGKSKRDEADLDEYYYDDLL